MQSPRLFSVFSLGAAVVALGLVGCGSSDGSADTGGAGGEGGHSIQTGSSSDAGSGGAGTGGGSNTSSVSGTTSSSSGSNGSSGAGGSNVPEGCTELTVADLTTNRVVAEQEGAAYYAAGFTPVLDSSLGYFVEYLNLSDETGTFDLGEEAEGGFVDCVHCFRIRPRSYDYTKKQYFQTSGTLTIHSSSAAEGKIDATVDDLTLVQIAFDSETSEPTVVPDGECLYVASAKLIGAGLPTAPEGWTCDAADFGDGFCDCGCGAIDNDCLTKTDADACAFCFECDGTRADSCDGISTTDTTTCIAP